MQGRRTGDTTFGKTTPAIASRGQNRVVFIFSKRTKLQQQREWTGRREREQRIHRERGVFNSLQAIYMGGWAWPVLLE